MAILRCRISEYENFTIVSPSRTEGLTITHPHMGNPGWATECVSYLHHCASLPGTWVYCTKPDVTHLAMSTRTVPGVPVISILTLTHRVVGDVTLVLSCGPTKRNRAVFKLKNLDNMNEGQETGNNLTQIHCNEQVSDTLHVQWQIHDFPDDNRGGWG